MNTDAIQKLETKYAPHKPFIPRSVFIGIPCHDGYQHYRFNESLACALAVLKQEGISYKVPTESGGGICLARQDLCTEFMESGMDCLFFIDGDLTFSVETFMNVLASPGDISTGIYPTKKFDISKFAALVRSGVDEQHAVAMTMSYPVNVSAEFVRGGKVELKHPGFLEVDEAPTGFMRIKRNVIGRVQVDNENLRYCNDFKRNQYAIFNNTLEYCEERSTPIFRGEDFSFCKLARKSGFNILASLTDEFGHIGPYEFKGHFGMSLLKEAV